MSTLATLSSVSQAAVDSLCNKIENKKDWTLNTIVEVYALDSAITPEHLLIGVKKKSSIGEVYAAWYAHKSGITTKVLNIKFIAENYGSIRVQDNAVDMQAELRRVASEQRDAQALADRIAAERGEALASQLELLSKEFDALDKAIFVPSAKSDAMIMALTTKVNSLVERYNLVANQRESVLTNA